jgi:hypothetical protein
MFNEELTNDKKKYIVLLMRKNEFIYKMYLFMHKDLKEKIAIYFHEIAFF